MSLSKAPCATPEISVCAPDPPKASWVVSSFVTVFTTFGPVTNMYEVRFTCSRLAHQSRVGGITEHILCVRECVCVSVCVCYVCVFVCACVFCVSIIVYACVFCVCYVCMSVCVTLYSLMRTMKMKSVMAGE